MAITTKATYECLSIYLPWADSGANASTVCAVEYRPVGGGTWFPGLDLWNDTANSQHTGTIVFLHPGTTYDVRLTCDSPSFQTTIQGATRSDVFPEGIVNAFGAKTSAFTITTADNGSAGGYTVFENGTMTTPNGGDGSGDVLRQLTIADDVHHVIIRNVRFDGGVENCIDIGDRCTDIVIENCYLTGWGALDGVYDSVFAADVRYNSAVATNTGGDSDVERITIQYCEFYNTKSGSHDWTDLEPRVGDENNQMAFTSVTDEGGGLISFTVADTTDVDVWLGLDNYAPKKFAVSGSANYNTQSGSPSYTAGTYPNLYAVASVTSTKIFVAGTFSGTDSGTLHFDDSNHSTGPHAIVFQNSIGGHVIRYNKFHAPNINRCYNDIFSGSSGISTTKGALGNDSDVYGNEISFAMDNALQVEGANQNNRVYHNYIHTCRIAIASAAVKLGPLYTFSNVITQCEGEREQPVSVNAFKVGNSSPGRQYWFFNTVTRDGATNHFTNFISLTGGGYVWNMFSRNNISDVDGRIVVDGQLSDTHDMDVDMHPRAIDFGYIDSGNYDGGTNPPAGSPLSGFFLGAPTFEPGGPFDGCNCNQLSAVSLGYRGGAPIKNFGMDKDTRATIADPDLGAMDPRMMPFEYGIRPASGGTATATAATVGTLTKARFV